MLNGRITKALGFIWSVLIDTVHAGFCQRIDARRGHNAVATPAKGPDLHEFILSITDISGGRRA
ncbi:Uncharacterised protein [Yersinia enterocolitica]|nr:Uncharacterised protein [Yersinia enterocolitica]